MIRNISFIALGLLFACISRGADQLTDEQIQNQRVKDGVEIVRFDLTKRGSAAIVEVYNDTDSEFSWRIKDMVPVNQIGEMGEVTNVSAMDFFDSLAIPAHKKKLYAVTYACPGTRPVAFIWRP